MPLQGCKLRRLAPFAVILLAALGYPDTDANGQNKRKALPVSEITYPPRLPAGQAFLTDQSDAFLQPTETLKPGVLIAKTPPVVDFMFYPGQDYPG